MKTEDARYAERLLALERSGIKRFVDVQRPYRRHLQALDLGFVLEVGCGVGRNLLHLGPGGGVGVDHNAHAVEIACARGAEAHTVERFLASRHARTDAFDALLLSHVAEHLQPPQARALLADYLRFVRPGGRLVLITPQERGFASDPTHVHFVDFEQAALLARDAGLQLLAQYSFPLRRPLGRWFRYNEFVTIARKPAGQASRAASM